MSSEIGITKNIVSRGMVKNSLADVRELPDGASPLVTQARLGESIDILEDSGEYYKISVTEQTRDGSGYVGWVLKSSIAAGEEYLDGTVGWILPKRAQVLAEPNPEAKPILEVLAQNALNVKGIRGEWCAVEVPGRSQQGWIPQSCLFFQYFEPGADSLFEAAEMFKGAPYLWGGMSYKGIDCSGLIYTVYERHGIILPRDADEQYLAGQDVDCEELLPGDLVFFGVDRIKHVGMYLGDGEVIHSSSRLGGVVISTLSEMDNYRCACRIEP